MYLFRPKAREEHSLCNSINFIKQCNFSHLSLRSLLHGENTASIDESCKQIVRTSFTFLKLTSSSALSYLVRIRRRFFRILAKNDKFIKNCF